MDGPGFDDPGEPVLAPTSRVRRAFTVAVVLTLVTSMVVLAFVSGRGVVTAPPQGSPSASGVTLVPDPSRIAVIDANGGLSTTDALGGSVVRYGEAGVDFSFPAWSPDGTRIAVLGQRDDESAVYVFSVPADGGTPGEPAVVYSTVDRPPFYLYWSPDGRQLTFLTTEPDGLALRLAPADASAPATAIRDGAPMYWSWAGTERLLVHSGGEGLAGFFGEVRPDGVATEPAAILPGAFRAPVVSSDGRYRAYVVPGDATPQRVMIETLDRTDPHRLDVFGAAALGFGAGSTELAFVAAAEAGRDSVVPVGPLRLMDATSGRVRTLLGGTVLAFFWAPDGKTIAAIEVPGPGDEKVAGGAAAVLVSTSGGRFAAAGARLRVTFVTVGSGVIRSRWAFTVSDLFIGQLLPFFDQYALSHRLWSPDSASIALPVVADDGTVQVMAVQADGANAVKLADGVAGFWSPSD
jgi:WD40-like Beta Propeller Repeat